MRNIFLFLRRYAVFFTFLCMQIVAWVMLFGYNQFHQTVYGMISAEISGNVNERVGRVETYFRLKEQHKPPQHIVQMESKWLLSRIKMGFQGSI